MTFIKNKELLNGQFKMNKIINRFLLNGDKFMPELHLKQPGFTYTACGPFSKHRERIQKFRETGHLKHSYRKELEKGCFAHDGAYSDNKNSAKRTISDKILKGRAYEIARIRNYDAYLRALASMVYKFFDRKTGPGISVNEQLAEELHRPLTKKFKQRKLYVRFKGNILGAGLAEMESFPSKYLLYICQTFVMTFSSNMHTLNL